MEKGTFIKEKKQMEGKRKGAKEEKAGNSQNY